MTKIVICGEWWTSQKEDEARLRRRCRSIIARIAYWAARSRRVMDEVESIAMKYGLGFDWMRPLRSLMTLLERIEDTIRRRIEEETRGKSPEEARRIATRIRREGRRDIARALRGYYLTRAIAQRIRELANEGVLRSCYLLTPSEEFRREVEEVLRRLLA